MGSEKLYEASYPAHGAARDQRVHSWLAIIAALIVAATVVIVSFVTMFVMVRQGAELGETKLHLKKTEAHLKEMEAQLSHLTKMEAQVQEMRQWREHLDVQVSPQGPGAHEQQNGAGRGKSATFLYGAEVHRRAKRSVSNMGKFANKITLPTTLGGCLAGNQGEPGRDGRDGPPGPTGPPGPPGSCCCSTSTPNPPPATRPLSSTVQPQTTEDPILEDCAAYLAAGQNISGVYTLNVSSTSVEAYCDMDNEGGGWTVIQRRQDGSVPFNRTWEEYKLGFGDPSGEYWLGNDNIHLLTMRKSYKLKIVLENWGGATRFAEYSTFWVSGEADGYRLHISGYSGNAGDSMTGSRSNNGQRFSTVDRDNDAHSSYHCSQHFGQGGWWFGLACGTSYLNGRYLGNCGSSCLYAQGVLWYHWRGYRYSLKSVTMKIRP